MQVIPLSRTDTLGDRKSKTLIAVYQPQLELVNVNPADIHWQARIHMWHVKRHTNKRGEEAGKQGCVGITPGAAAPRPPQFAEVRLRRCC